MVVRLSVDYLVRWAKLTASVQGGDLLAALVLATAYQASTDHLDQVVKPDGPPGAADPEALRRTITSSAIAAALGQPRETVRRKVKLLVDRGLLQVRRAGVFVPDSALRTDVAVKVIDDLLSLTRGYVQALDATGLAEPNSHHDKSANVRADRLLRLTNTFCLRMFEDMGRGAGGDVILPMVFCAISVANTRHLEVRWDAPHASFDPPMPDEARRPISMLALAEEVGLPRETMRRYVARLAAAGGCRRVRGGVIAVESTFETSASRASNTRICVHARRFLEAWRASSP